MKSSISSAFFLACLLSIIHASTTVHLNPTSSSAVSSYLENTKAKDHSHDLYQIDETDPELLLLLNSYQGIVEGAMPYVYPTFTAIEYRKVSKTDIIVKYYIGHHYVSENR